MKIKLLGIDLAKNVFQLCALNQANKALFNRTVARTRFRSTIAQLDSTTIALEACSSAHYWGRSFEAMGHRVVLVPAQHVTPFVRGGKSDARDALAICEAAQRPGLHPVPIKTIEQQDIQLLHRLRQRQVQHSNCAQPGPAGFQSLHHCLHETLFRHATLSGPSERLPL